MSTPGADELARAHDRKDWHYLWLAARPLVALTLKRMMQRGELGPTQAIENDLKQEGMLAAGRHIRTWDTLEGSFGTWVVTKVRGAILDYIRKEMRRGFGGGGEDLPFLVSAQESICEADSEDDDAAGEVKQDLFVYDEEVFPSPEALTDRAIAMGFLDRCDSVDREILCRLYGIDCDPQTLSETAMATGVSLWQVRDTVGRLRRLMSLTD